MSKPFEPEGKWNERCNAPEDTAQRVGDVFQQFLHKSADAIWLFDPAHGVFVDCNQAAVELMRCGTADRLLQSTPDQLSPEFQADGRSSRERVVEIIAEVEKRGSLRFEWLARRFDGELVPLEVLSTALEFSGRKHHAIISRDISDRKAAETALRESENKFRLLFQHSADGIIILDPETQMPLDCNQTAVSSSRSGTREWLLSQPIAALAPDFQPDGSASHDRAAELISRALREGTQRFEWTARRRDGENFPVEVLLTPLEVSGRRLLVVVSREITLRKEAESRVRQLNFELERRIAERTQELLDTNRQLRLEITERERTEALLKESEARARTLVEHAPDAIVVFDFETGRFIDANPNAERLYGVGREALLKLGPAETSPAIQPNGRPSAELAREKLEQALAGETPVFDWWHRHSNGQIIPCEIRLVRLPAQGRRLIRGSIIDNTARERTERIQKAIYQISEAVHTADDLGSLYRKIHAIVQGLMLASNFYIALYDPVSELFSFPYFVDEMDPPPGPRRLTTGLTSYVLKTGKPLLANRRAPIRKESSGVAVVVDASSEVPYIEAGTPAAVWLGAPLRVRGETIGVLAVQDYLQENAYGEEHQRILAFVADQIATAIDRKRAEQALRQRSDQIARHRDVLLELAQLDKSDLCAALARICQLSAESLNVARVSYWGWAEDEASIRCQVLYTRRDGKWEFDSSAETLCIARKDCPAYFEALTGRRPIAATHALVHPATKELGTPYLLGNDVASVLNMPVWHQGRVVGVLCHDQTGLPREWTPEEVDFASSLGTIVSLAHEAARRARSEQALRESEAKFRALFEASSQGVMIHDEEKFLEVNPATVRILGYESADEILGKHPAETSVPIQPNGESADVLARRHIGECMTRGSVRFEWLGRLPRGGEVPLEVILTRIPMGGRYIIQAVINDITDRKKAEAELLRALAREKELGQLKSSFVSMVSHEFRTPLGIIMSSAEILQDYFGELESEERQHHLQSITKNTRRMADLMEEVLLLGRFEAGKMNFQPAPLDLGSFCRRLVDEILSATDRCCPIELAVERLPGEALADERLLRHILTNLITNAVKYSEKGQLVVLALRAEERNAIFVVRDRGIGIPPADQEWLFNAFHRGRNVGSRPGSGLGLVIVKRCVELHGGRIKIESQVGVGTVATVRLSLFDEASSKG